MKLGQMVLQRTLPVVPGVFQQLFDFIKTDAKLPEKQDLLQSVDMTGMIDAVIIRIVSQRL
jgi:hypothetical protein